MSNKFYHLGYYKVLVVGGYSDSGELSSVEVIDFETSAITCNEFTSFPTPFRGGIGGLGFQNEPLTCKGMSLIYILI